MFGKNSEEIRRGIDGKLGRIPVGVEMKGEGSSVLALDAEIWGNSTPVLLSVCVAFCDIHIDLCSWILNPVAARMGRAGAWL